MLDDIKLLLGLNSAEKDKLLRLLINRATTEAKTYTHQDDVTVLEPVICNMVIYNYNQLGVEGITSEEYSGCSFDYSSSYPDSIMNSLKSLRKVRVIG